MGARRVPVGFAVMVPVVIACAFYAFTAAGTVANPDERPDAAAAAATDDQPPCPDAPGGGPLPCIALDVDTEAPGLQHSRTLDPGGPFDVDVWIRNVPEGGIGSFNFTLLYDRAWLTAGAPKPGPEVAGLLGRIEDKAWSCEPPPASGDLPENWGPSDHDPATGDAFLSCFSAGTPSRPGDFVLATVPFTSVRATGEWQLHLWFTFAADASANTIVACEGGIDAPGGPCLEGAVRIGNPATPAARSWTGNATVDAIIDAFAARDSDALAQYAGYTKIACSYEQGYFPDNVPCRDPEADGDIVDAFVSGTCNSALVRGNEAPALLDAAAGQTLHAVIGANGFFGPAADYTLLYSPDTPDDPSSTIVNIVDDRVVGVIAGCGSLLSPVPRTQTGSFSWLYQSTALRDALDVAPPEPPPYPTPSLSRGAFHDGAWVRVNAGAGDCLNARYQPSLKAEYNMVNACLPDGFEGMLTGAASEADGHWWWFMAGTGYVAEDYLTYLRDVDPRAQPLAALPGAGRLAFLREGDIWVLDAAGQRKLVDRDDNAQGVSRPDAISWSPDGSLLAYSTYRYDVDASSVELHIVDLQGREVRVVAGALGGGWAPDGSRIAIVRVETTGKTGGDGTPGWLDIATGEEHLLAESHFYQEAFPSFNFDGTLLLYTRYDDPDADGVAQQSIAISDLAGNELHRIDAPTNTYYGGPRWAPDSNRIAFHVSAGDRPHYAVFDVDAGAFTAEAAVPQANPNLGGRCGGADMWHLEWSPGGQRIAYSYGFGLAGKNGVWTWEIASGKQALVPASFAGPASWGAADAFVFASGGGAQGYIFLVAGGQAPRLLTEGYSPTWWPGAR